MAKLRVLILKYEWLLGYLYAIFLLVEFFYIGWRKIDIIHIFLWKFIEFNVDDARRVTVILETIMVDKVYNVMEIVQPILHVVALACQLGRTVRVLLKLLYPLV